MISIMSAAAIDPLAPTTLYAWAHGGGVFKSADGGGSWSASNTGLMTHTDVAALAIDPLTPTTLYAETNYGVFMARKRGGRGAASGAVGGPAARIHPPTSPPPPTR